MEKYILGNVRKIIFESNSGPYKVGLFKVKETNDESALEYVDKVISFTGSFNELNDSVEYIFYGEMVNHPKYGLQYNVSSYEIKVPDDTDSLILYLSSGLFKGIGSKTAKKLVDKFGKEIIDIIKNDYESLCDIIPIKKARMIHDIVCKSELNEEAIIKLNTLGFSMKEAVNLSNIYGSSIFDVIENDIYELVDYVSFDKLDLIYLNQNNNEMDGIRVKALIKHLINKMCNESGDTLLFKDELFINMKKCFNEDFDSFKYIHYLDELISEGEVIELNELVTLFDYYDAETSILKDISRISSIRDVVSDKKIDSLIKTYEKKNKITFDNEQKDAIRESIVNNFYIITGGPGTGKTTIIKCIVNILEELYKINKSDIALLAPTGRSAKRMSESVLAPAYTIHKFLRWNKETETFGIDEYNRASERIIIVDEASMIDIFLFSSLLKGIRVNAKLILIGDENQLPSIGPGDVLRDLLRINGIKSKLLNKIYRVKEGSYITYLANDIKNKKEFDHIDNYDDFKFIECNDEEIKPYLKELCNKIKSKNINIDSFQVLAPMYKGINGIDNLNNMLSDIFNPDNEKYQIDGKYYKIGDKVIQLINDVENNVFNGDIGYISSIENIDGKLEVVIDYSGNLIRYKSNETDRFNLAYAISVHKAQGSEYDNVVVILSSSFKRMFYNKLIYTAVTRAKHSLIVLGSLNSFNTAIKTLYADNRNTYLKLAK